MSITFFGFPEIILLTFRNLCIILILKGGINMTLGEKIKTARIAKGLTQRQLAELINAKHNSVSDWENDKSKPDIDTIELICGALDLTPTYIMGTKTTEEYGNIVGLIMKDPEILDMIAEYRELLENDKKAIRQIISSLYKNSRE